MAGVVSLQPAKEPFVAPRQMSSKDVVRVAPLVDIVETAEAFLLSANLPGASMGAINVDFDCGSLTIQADIDGAEMEQQKFLHREFRRRSYFRRFEIAEEIAVEQISAEYSDGVLSLRLPRALPGSSRRVKIDVG